MKKILIGLFFLSVIASYAENNYPIYGFDEIEGISSEEQLKKMELEKKREKILEYEKLMNSEKDRKELKRLHDEYDELFSEYITELKGEQDGLFKFGDYYFKANRYDVAFQVFSQDDSNIKSLFGAATTARMLNNLNTSIKFYDKVLNLDSNFYEAYLGRGLSYRNLGNYEAAIADFNKYMVFQKNESIYIALGDVYMAVGNYKEAKDILEIGQNKYPNSQLIRGMLTRVYARLK